MKNTNRWSVAIIAAASIAVLTQILPTLIYYSKPLSRPLSKEEIVHDATTMASNVNQMADVDLSWIQNYANFLKLSVKEIQIDQNQKQWIHCTFKTTQDAQAFHKLLPIAGANRTFTPAQLSVLPLEFSSDKNTVTVVRKIQYKFPTERTNFNSFRKFNEDGQLSQDYLNFITGQLSRTLDVLAHGAGFSPHFQELASTPISQWDTHTVLQASSSLLEWKKLFPLCQEIENNLGSILNSAFNTSGTVHILKENLQAWLSKQEADKELSNEQLQNVQQALTLLNTLNTSTAKSSSQALASKVIESSNTNISLLPQHPLIKSVRLDSHNAKLILEFWPQIHNILAKDAKTEEQNWQKDLVKQKIYSLISDLKAQVHDQFNLDHGQIESQISQHPDYNEILALELSALYEQELAAVKNIFSIWDPKHTDLNPDNFPLVSFKLFSSGQMAPADRAICATIVTPMQHNNKALNNSSIYLILNGFEHLSDAVVRRNIADEMDNLMHDLRKLHAFMQSRGYIAYPSDKFPIAGVEGALIFECPRPTYWLLTATRSNWQLSANYDQAILEYGTYLDHIKHLNRIDDQIHEENLATSDNFNRAQVDLNPSKRLMHAPSTHNLYWDNFALTLRKIFRGDQERVLKWGMDLSGGKTVRLALFDHNQKKVTSEELLRQSQNELAARINKMGLAEVAIRIEGDYLVVDFPSSQSISASELIQASKMSFHVVNEKFSLNNPKLASQVNEFLQSVWNEALVTGKKDIDSLNEIASRLLGYEHASSFAKIQSAKELRDAGLKIICHEEQANKSSINEELSMIAPFRSDDKRDWSGQNHPLVITFRNFALEGANIDNVHAAYDQARGNILNFSVRSKSKSSDSYNPQDDLYQWTKRYSLEGISGTELEEITQSRAWRMAVILNGEIVSAPGLPVALKDHAMIHGNFSQREVQRLSADIQAGSLSFTPKILSEENISPDLGLYDRQQGITAAALALIFVVFGMSWYYRFAGVIASVAVVFNLLVTWAVLQNLGAALTLAGIAGVVLTVGMSVDANVLIFERIREELQRGKSLLAAIEMGYKRAFSAILDSNLTTILAAFILIQFDSGPIKGFAMTLIIGIGASMFTALFMTKTFFNIWARKKGDGATLTFCQWVKNPNFDFFKYKNGIIAASILFIASGFSLLYMQKDVILGMDFSGGYGLNFTIRTPTDHSHRPAITQALLKAGMHPTDFDIREVDRANRIKLQINGAVDSNTGVFAHLDDRPESMQKRVEWIANALHSSGVEIKEPIDELTKNWTSISSQFSQTMRSHALLAITVALIGILIYITARFEWRYALSSVLGLSYDLLITFSAIAWMRFFDLPIQIDLQAVGAIMTIIGYALNDTIIIFDRIREDGLSTLGKQPANAINIALNQTLSRTLITSGTTLIALLALNILGGVNLFSFSIIMTLGVVVGTFCSLFVTSYLLLVIWEKSNPRT